MTGTPKLIQAVGEALFGLQWQTELGYHLAVNRRTVQRWLSGRNEPMPGVWSDIEALLRERAAEQLRLCKEVRHKTETVR
jgi:hypothetical protein